MNPEKPGTEPWRHSQMLQSGTGRKAPETASADSAGRGGEAGQQGGRPLQRGREKVQAEKAGPETSPTPRAEPETGLPENRIAEKEEKGINA